MEDLWQNYGPVLVVLAAAVAALLVVEVIYRIVRWVARRAQRRFHEGSHGRLVRSVGKKSGRLLSAMAQRAYRPTQLLVVLGTAAGVIAAGAETGAWRGPAMHGLLIGVILAAAWLVASLLLSALDAFQSFSFAGTPEDVRRFHTQADVLHRVVGAAVMVLAICLALMTFAQVRTIGTTLLASAGLVGVIAALAAQNTLGNVFAGLQLLSNSALRLGNVVEVDGMSGTIEERTLTSVVVKLSENRRLLLPASHFTANTFKSYTMYGDLVRDYVELDVDWSVPVDALQQALTDYVSGRAAGFPRLVPLYDPDAALIEVIGVSDRAVKVRARVEAEPDDVFDVQCAVRTFLVGWLQQNHPEALPRTRAELSGGPVDSAASPALGAAPAPGPAPAVAPGVVPAPARRRGRSDAAAPVPATAPVTAPAKAAAKAPAKRRGAAARKLPASSTADTSGRSRGSHD